MLITTIFMGKYLYTSKIDLFSQTSQTLTLTHHTTIGQGALVVVANKVIKFEVIFFTLSLTIVVFVDYLKKKISVFYHEKLPLEIAI